MHFPGTFSLLLGVVIAVPAPLPAQGQPLTKPKTQAGAAGKPARPKLTPQQERGYQMLESAEAEASGLQPDMRAFLLSSARNAIARS
ncbi:MAG TPA: hypothetical protein VFA89_07320 [Terriglobales bacterium]|nr:hypothetical protein [Terriglobales bacterium]